MIRVVPCEAAHLLRIQPQRAQLSEVHAESLAAPAGMAWAALVDDEPIAAAGLVEVWPGRAYAWALLADAAGRHLLAITREIRSRLAAAGFRRVELAVDAGFAAGRRWAPLLGFHLETPEPMRAYLPNGRDAYLYARVT